MNMMMTWSRQPCRQCGQFDCTCNRRQRCQSCGQFDCTCMSWCGDACGTTPVFETLTIERWIGGKRGPLVLRADPVCPEDAATKRYVDRRGTTAFVGDIPPRDPQIGTLWWDTRRGQMFVWYADHTSPAWVIANNTGIPDAPADGFSYGRENNKWVRVLNLNGGTMLGPLILSGDPTDPLGAVTKQYVDNTIANQLTGYLPLTGGVMTGGLTLAGDPIQPLQAATKQYVDNHIGTVHVGTSPPQFPVQGKLWYDSISCQLFIWYNNGIGPQWVQANVPTFGGGQPGGTFGGIYYGDEPPTPANLGAIWISTGGIMHVWNGTAWIQVGGTGMGDIFYGPVAPTAPTVGMLWVTPGGNLSVFNGSSWVEVSDVAIADSGPTDGTHALWWDNTSGHLFIWYDDGVSAQWVIIDSGGTGSGVPS